MALPTLLCQVSSRVHLCLKSKHVFSPIFGVSGEVKPVSNPNSHSFLDFSSILFTYYIGEKKNTLHTHIFY